MSKCSECGGPAPKGMDICPECANEMAAEQKKAPAKKKQRFIVKRGKKAGAKPLPGAAPPWMKG